MGKHGKPNIPFCQISHFKISDSLTTFLCFSFYYYDFTAALYLFLTFLGPSRRSSKWLSPLSPATPSFLGNTLTPGLHEGASMQSLKSKDDSFLLQFKENSVIDPRNVRYSENDSFNFEIAIFLTTGCFFFFLEVSI